MTSHLKEEILGFKIDISSVDSIVSSIEKKLSVKNSFKPFWLACFNPHSYYISCQDNQFLLALKSANWLIPDGIGAVIASKILRLKIHERVTGFDIFIGLHHRLNQKKVHSVFFLGSIEMNLKKIATKFAKDYPNINIAGSYSPPYKTDYSQDELDQMIDLINQSKADVLWVGMTAPKQEKWIYQNKNRLNVKFIGAIGAVFDFYTGEVKRSPVLFQKLGLEWLPRLIQQPKRLWRRMFISAPYFLWHVIIKK